MTSDFHSIKGARRLFYTGHFSLLVTMCSDRILEAIAYKVNLKMLSDANSPQGAAKINEKT